MSFNLYVHRIIGVSGDEVHYSFISNLGYFSVNSEKFEVRNGKLHGYNGVSDSVSVEATVESRGDSTYSVLHEAGLNAASIASSFFYSKESGKYPMLFRDKCVVGNDGFSCTVPDGYVFVVGDNRNHSLYGFVDVNEIVGYVVSSSEKN